MMSVFQNVGDEKMHVTWIQKEDFLKEKWAIPKKTTNPGINQQPSQSSTEDRIPPSGAEPGSVRSRY